MTTRAHGSYVKYVQDHCRCDACRHANRTYERERKQRREPPYVSAVRARAHIAELAEQGVGLKSIARITGVSHGGLTKLVYGTQGRPPSRRIRKSTEDAILSVTPDRAPGGTREPAAPIWKIVDQLLERGWTKVAIGRAVHGPQAVALQLGDEYVSRANARAVRALLDELVPPRVSRWGLHVVAELEDPTDTNDDLADLARRQQAAERKMAERDGIYDPYQLPYLRDVGDQAWRDQAACRHDTVPTYISGAA